MPAEPMRKLCGTNQAFPHQKWQCSDRIAKSTLKAI